MIDKIYDGKGVTGEKWIESIYYIFLHTNLKSVQFRYILISR